MLAILIVGLVTGSVYGLIATGLVLTYKTSGIFNFAYGALATAAAYVFYGLVVDAHVPKLVALVIAVVGLSAVLGVVLGPLAERLVSVDLSLQVAATVGLLLVIEAIAELAFGVNTRQFPSFLPQRTVQVAGTPVGYDQIITFAISLACAVALNTLLRRSRSGIQMRAVVDNSDLLAISGGRPSAVRRLAWTIGSVLVTLSGLLFAPSVGLNATVLTSLALLAFGAAALGGFRSVNLAWVGGLVIGIPQAIMARYINSTSFVGHLSASLPFIVLFLAILFYPKARLGSALARRSSMRIPLRLPRRYELGTGTVVLIFLLCVPLFAGFRVTDWAATIATCVLLLSLGLLVRLSGQVSLSQLAFAAIGACAFSKFAVEFGIPWLPALLLAGLVTVPVGMLLAVPAVRLSGLYLALATFAFGYALQDIFYQTTWMFGPTNSGIAIPVPQVRFVNFDDQTFVYYLILAISLILVASVVALERSRSGRLLRGLADTAVGLETLGASVMSARLLIFGISSFLAGISGALIGVVYGYVNGLSYSPDTSLLYLVLITIVVGRAPWFALVAGVGVGVIPTYVSGDVTYYLQIVFGLSALAAGLGVTIPAPSAVRSAFRSLASRDGAVSSIVAAPAKSAALDDRASPAGAADLAGTAGREVRGEGPRPSLEVSGVTVRFGGLIALDNVSVVAPAGRITGVIGPNGAGKTTLFNVCSGLIRTRAGRVSLAGSEISRKSPSARARLGIGRTYQHMELFDSLTVEQNVRLGREAGMAGRNPVSIIMSRRGDGRDVERRAADAMAACGISELRGSTVGALSTGSRRLVELARCLAGNFPLLLLDEPSSGLDSSESLKFKAILDGLVAERGIGILLVEHDVELVMDMCSHIYVLDFGRVVFEGSPSEVRASPIVQASYLGEVAV